MATRKRWLLLMKRDNLVKCEAGTKTQTRRTNKRLEGILAGDELYFRHDYKTTYNFASGPYIATADAGWAIARKMAFNETRGYRHGGKKA